MKTAVVLIALAAALALQTTLSGLMIGGRIRGESGARGGRLSSPWPMARSPGCWRARPPDWRRTRSRDRLVGIGGLSKTLMGFLVGVLGAQFIVSQTMPRFVMFVGATFLHEVVFEALHALVEGRGVRAADVDGAGAGARERGGRDRGFCGCREGTGPRSAASDAAREPGQTEILDT